MAENKDAFYSQVKQIGALTAIPFLLVLGPLVGYFVGNWIDLKFGFTPWFSITFLILGFVASGREIYSLLRRVWVSDKKKS